jgi:hypothetical protein
MQVLSQLSYNPTDFVGPLVGPISEAGPAQSPELLDGRVPRSSFAGFHRSRLAVNDGQRVLLPRQRIGVEDSTGKRHGSIGDHVLVP